MATARLLPVDPDAADEVAGPGVAVHERRRPYKTGEEPRRVSRQRSERFEEVEVAGEPGRPAMEIGQLAPGDVAKTTVPEHRCADQSVVQRGEVGERTCSIMRLVTRDFLEEQPLLARVDDLRNRNRQRTRRQAKDERLSRDPVTRTKVEQVYYFANYHAMNGVMTPLQTSQDRNGMRIAQTFLDRCDYNQNPPEASFNRDTLDKRWAQVSDKEKAQDKKDAQRAKDKQKDDQDSDDPPKKN